MKRIYFIRHANAEKGNARRPDHERGLDEIGVSEAKTIGTWLQKNNCTAGFIACSTANRTQQTSAIIKTHCQNLPNAEYIDSLYLASAGDMLSYINKSDDTHDTLMIIAHNPGIAELCRSFDMNGLPSVYTSPLIKFDTATICIVEADVNNWRELSPNNSLIKICVNPYTINNDIL